ncbi:MULTISPECIES: glycosyltransferase family 39 protein [unclassified Mesorhizobium]|uniref:ArnT family glycosyltransferase n=1 Tax=unclassified Mesorhizobium TaxID=325217 RepID=UPI001FEDC999|nr:MULTISPECIES: glycosyltransferase family 39 protein [unclassified Mesorhizobium]
MQYLEKWTDWLCEGKVGPFNAALACLAVYCLVQIVVMALLSHIVGTGVGVDDSEQLMYMHYLWAGYGGSQPPLYTWLARLVAGVLGTNILALKIVKYLLIGVALASAFIAVRRLGYSSRAGAAAMFGLLLFPQMVWEMQHALTHSIAAFCFSVVLFLALVELVQRRSLLAYVLFGVAIAAAILSKYNNVIFLAALILSTLSLRETRGVVLNRRFLISVAVAVLLCLPTFYWSLTHTDQLLSHAGGFGMARENGVIQKALTGVWGLGKAMLNFAGLPAGIFAVAFLIARNRPAPSLQPPPWAEKLVWRTIAFAFAITIVLVLASGATQFRDRWMLPILVLLPTALAIHMDARGDRGRKVQDIAVFVGATLAILVLPLTWYAHLYGGDSRGSVVRMDYTALYAQLTANGPIRTTVSSWHWLGNLRLIDPDLIVLDEELPDFSHLLKEPAVLVTTNDKEDVGAVLELLDQAGYVADGPPQQLAVPQLFGSDPPTRIVTVTRLKKVTAAAGAAPQ